MIAAIEYLLFTAARGAMSRLRLALFRSLGMRVGARNRFEGRSRVRRYSQIELGSLNAFTEGTWLWPADADYSDTRIRIGDENYFNRNVMIDACGLIEIGSQNMFGPDVYITDSNHGFGHGAAPHKAPMAVGRVKIGNRCWIGAKAIILKDVEIGDGSVVAAGAVVTRSVAPCSVVGGVPARPLRRLMSPDEPPAEDKFARQIASKLLGNSKH